MLKFLSVFCGWLLSGSISQAPPSSFPDTPAITENSVGRARIGMPIAQLRQLYKGCTFTPVHLLAYGFDDTNAKPGGVMVKKGSQQLFLYFPDWQTKQKVAGLLAFHPSYKTAKGIHPGSTSGQLKTALPTVRVVPNMMLPTFQIAFVGDVEKPGIEYIFSKQPALAKYVVADEPTKLTAPNGRISWIQIHPNP
ncbi:hypothetical protein [Hymenobacter properus]|uniref:Uncharacterized protein n=1 Tax=Hymenobacter properus TaxID=2791026 RepID=A0A931BIR4_9BACT|nr:hypothetical protein [Hymenobacter properus]MBF9142117.1 hypothetical protein [Hymenobacter properus]MBR7720924.1 hypothetical protein [Microvirga sp. SRT04]